jgi:glucose-1-phosphate thymidylyltransferase
MRRTRSMTEAGRGYAWLDTGPHDSLLDAATFVATIQTRQALIVSCPEENAYGQKWIDASQVESLAHPLSKSHYGQYLLKLIQ